MDVILSLDLFPSLSKKGINEGIISEASIKIANFLRTTFILSNSLLHENNLIVYCTNHFSASPTGLIIFFNGRKLRYLAPDERGILFLLLKIHKVITGEGGKKQEKKEHLKFHQLQKAQSTPGIYLKRGVLDEIWKMHPSFEKEFILIGKTEQQHSKLSSFRELENVLHPKTVLVFNKIRGLEFNPPFQAIMHEFAQESWKAKFNDSELISYIQAKIISGGLV